MVDRTPVNIQVTGLKELVAECKAVSKALPKELAAINKDAAAALVPIARGLCPHVTGDLASSIRAGATARSGTIKAGGTKGVLYAPPIHWGWPSRNISPQPFLMEALQGNVLAISERYEKNLQTFLDRNFV